MKNWTEFTFTQERGKELKIEMFENSDIYFKNFRRKYNHKRRMAITKILGKYHIKIPKCSRSRIRGRA